MTSSWFRHQGALQAILHDGFWKSDHDLLIVFHSNFLSGMYDFQDNKVLLPTGYDVIVISPLGGVLHRFCWQNLKERSCFIIMVRWHISRICYRFEIMRHFILAGNCPLRPILGCYCGKTPQNFTTTHFSSPKGSSLHQTASFELLCAKIGSRVGAVALLKNKKNKKN